MKTTMAKEYEFTGGARISEEAIKEIKANSKIAKIIPNKKSEWILEVKDKNGEDVYILKLDNNGGVYAGYLK